MFKKLMDENPKTVSFVLGIVIALVLVMILYFIFREHFIPTSGSWADEFALVHGAVQAENPAVGSSQKVPEQFQTDAPLATTTPQSAVDPRFFPMAQEKDNDDKAMEYMVSTRGDARRPIYDHQRSKYMSLAKLGGADYEGYTWDGRPSNDENGLLNARVWGIDSSYEKYPM